MPLTSSRSNTVDMVTDMRTATGGNTVTLTATVGTTGHATVPDIIATITAIATITPITAGRA